MQFAIIAYDGTDAAASQRRLKVRGAHIALGNELVRSGNGLFGAAILDEDNKMIGSIEIVEFDSRVALDEYLSKEPYV